MITATTDTLTVPETIARQITIIEVESWFSVLKTLATDLRCRVQLENRIQKSAIIYRAMDGKKPNAQSRKLRSPLYTACS